MTDNSDDRQAGQMARDAIAIEAGDYIWAFNLYRPHHATWNTDGIWKVISITYPDWTQLAVVRIAVRWMHRGEEVNSEAELELDQVRVVTIRDMSTAKPFEMLNFDDFPPVLVALADDTPAPDALAAAMSEVERLRFELDYANEQIDAAKEAVRKAHDLERYIYYDGLASDIESIASSWHIWVRAGNEKDARIAELEAALKPFADAVDDADVKVSLDSAALWVNNDTYLADYHIIAAGEDSEGDGIILEVRHLRDAAIALKGSKP